MRLTSIIIWILAPAASLAGELCIAPGGGGKNVTVDCAVFQELPNTAVGYRTDGAPCRDAIICYGWDFGWTISSSDVDPYVNSGPLAPGASLYLWYVCGVHGGAAAAEFSLQGDIGVKAFIPLNDALNVGTDTDLLLAFRCLTGPSLVGRIVTETDAISVEGASWGRIKGVYR